MGVGKLYKDFSRSKQQSAAPGSSRKFTRQVSTQVKQASSSLSISEANRGFRINKGLRNIKALHDFVCPFCNKKQVIRISLDARKRLALVRCINCISCTEEAQNVSNTLNPLQKVFPFQTKFVPTLENDADVFFRFQEATSELAKMLKNESSSLSSCPFDESKEVMLNDLTSLDLKNRYFTASQGIMDTSEDADLNSSSKSQDVANISSDPFNYKDTNTEVASTSFDVLSTDALEELVLEYLNQTTEV